MNEGSFFPMSSADKVQVLVILALAAIWLIVLLIARNSIAALIVTAVFSLFIPVMAIVLTARQHRHELAAKPEKDPGVIGGLTNA